MESVFTVPALIVLVICSFTPLPAIRCFNFSWERDPDHNISLTRRILYVIPTAVCPVALLIVHALTSELSWKAYGANHVFYMAKGQAAWIYLPPFAAANYLVARTVIDSNYARNTLLPELSLVTCILICGCFTIANIDRYLLCIFPLSATIAYSNGLLLLLRLHGRIKLLKRHVAILCLWLISAFSTVFASTARSKQLVASLSDYPPECFIVSAAAHGHRFVVCSEVDALTGQTVNNQLKVFRAFEARLAQRMPRIHKLARRIYNKLGPLVARSMIFRWQADLVYILLKPFEWAIRLARLS